MTISALAVACAALVLGVVGGAIAARALKAGRQNAAATASMENILQQVKP